MWNMKQINGYAWHKTRKRFRAHIYVDAKAIYLGSFKTEEEAHAAYKAAKLIYHVIK